MSAPKFSIGQSVTTHAKGFEPVLADGAIGTITAFVLNSTGKPGYDIDVETVGGPANLFFYETEIKPV